MVVAKLQPRHPKIGLGIEQSLGCDVHAERIRAKGLIPFSHY